MPSMKSDSERNKRATLNTTIGEDALAGFKGYCKELGYPMNLVLEAFMHQFNSGEFVLKIAKANKMSVELLDDEK